MKPFKVFLLAFCLVALVETGLCGATFLVLKTGAYTPTFAVFSLFIAVLSGLTAATVYHLFKNRAPRRPDDPTLGSARRSNGDSADTKKPSP